jgi:hypothetical protein
MPSASHPVRAPHRLQCVDLREANPGKAARRPRPATKGANIMATANTTSPPGDDEVPDEPIPAMQQLLDNPFLLLFIGIAMPTVLYIVWGVMEIVGIPIAK